MRASRQEKAISSGHTSKDEMCNLYLMVYGQLPFFEWWVVVGRSGGGLAGRWPYHYWPVVSSRAICAGAYAQAQAGRQAGRQAGTAAHTDKLRPPCCAGARTAASG